MEGMCKCWGFKKILLGVLILLNVFWLQLWSGVEGWMAFFGVLLLITGVAKVVYPQGCPRCCSLPAAAKKKR